MKDIKLRDYQQKCVDTCNSKDFGEKPGVLPDEPFVPEEWLGD